jgi:hypothetical protein
MLKITLIYFFSIYLFLGSIYSQENIFENYAAIQCKGKVPLDFRKPSYAKYQEDKDLNISKEEKKRLRKSKDEFYLSTNYFIDELLTSGNVLFGDTLTQFVNEVGIELLNKSGKKELLDKVSFYVVKSSQVNAFATQQGLIFVTNGLLAQIQNREQLAYMLAHEIAHYEKNHNINTFLVREKLKKDYQKGKREFKALLKNLSSFSQDQELEADQEGFKTYNEAGYSSKNAYTSLIVLQYSHLPFDEIKFNHDYFNNDYYKLPKTYFGDTAIDANYNDEKDEEEQYSSHPDISKRKKLLQELIDKNGSSQEYIKNDDPKFNYIQKISRFENLNINLLGGEYTRVIYEGYLLDRLYPNNFFIKESIAKGLYGVSKLKTYSNSNMDMEEIAESFEGESKVLYELFFDELFSVESTILALKYMNGIKQDNLYEYKVDLALDLIEKHDLKISNFKTSGPLLNDTVIEKDTIVFGDSVWNSMTKIEKLNYKKGKRKENEGYSEVAYYLYAFVNELKDSSFVQIFNEASKNKIFKTTDEVLEDMSYDEKIDYYKKLQKSIKKPSKLGIDTLIVLSPSFTEIKKHKTQKVESEKKEIQYNQIITECAEKIDLNITIFSAKVYSENDLELFNDETIIKEWLSEYGYYIDFHMIPMTQNKIDAISNKYNTNDILITGIIRYRDLRQFNVGAFALSLIFYPTLPFYLGYLLYQPHHNDFFYAVLNTDDISLKMLHTKEAKGKDQVLKVKSLTYDTFYHIKNK